MTRLPRLAALDRPGLPCRRTAGFLAAGALVATLALPPAAAASELWVTAPDGARIAVTARGDGETTLLFVHCWSCDRGTWGDQLGRLADGHRVVALDLPGHGASGAVRESWTIAGYGADVAAVIDALDLRGVILVGHSMGGPVALEAARLRPERVAGVIAVDTLLDVDFVFPEEQWSPMRAAFVADFADACQRFVTDMFRPTSDPELVGRTRGAICDADPAVAIPLLDEIFRYDQISAFEGIGVPVRGINATTFPTDFAANQGHGDYDAVVMEGVGHFPHLEKPAEFEQHLRRWIAELAPPAAERSERHP